MTPRRQDSPALTLDLNGVRYAIVQDPAVRARDLRDHTLTVERQSDGKVMVVSAVELQAANARPRRLPVPRRRWKLRVLAERIASLPDEPVWTAQMVQFASLNGLLETPDHVPVGSA